MMKSLFPKDPNMSFRGLAIRKLLPSYIKQVSHHFLGFPFPHFCLIPPYTGGTCISYQTTRGTPFLFTDSTSGFVVRTVRNPHLKHPLQVIWGSDCFINGSLVQFAPELINLNAFHLPWTSLVFRTCPCRAGGNVKALGPCPTVWVFIPAARSWPFLQSTHRAFDVS